MTHIHVEIFYTSCRIKESNVKNTLRIMRVEILVGLDDMPIEVWKCAESRMENLLLISSKPKDCQMTGEEVISSHI